ncbi:hypothetical protein M8J76_010296 [Diaphorina citri]|nr:hypothetical protein M8J76_010296 [Diaphorina citri]
MADTDVVSREEEKKIVHTYPLVHKTDMADELMTEVVDLCSMACEKHAANLEQASRVIKDTMDKKYGPAWHVVVGETFGFEITYECKSLLYMFFGGNLAICMWKCS